MYMPVKLFFSFLRPTNSVLNYTSCLPFRPQFLAQQVQFPYSMPTVLFEPAGLIANLHLWSLHIYGEPFCSIRIRQVQKASAPNCNNKTIKSS